MIPSAPQEAPAPGAALTLTGVTWRGDAAGAASGVSLRVPPGQSVAIHSDPPGDAAGLLDVIAGLRRPRSGQVLVDDIAVDQLSGAGLDHYLAGLGLLSARFPPLPARSATDIEQQWRVMIARAVRPLPRLVLAEDPTTTLDGHGADAVLDLLTDVHAKLEFTLLLAVTSLATASRFQRLIRLAGGMVVDDELIGTDPLTRDRIDRIG